VAGASELILFLDSASLRFGVGLPFFIESSGGVAFSSFLAISNPLWSAGQSKVSDCLAGFIELYRVLSFFFLMVLDRAFCR
jgi:hypothetical protein